LGAKVSVSTIHIVYGMILTTMVSSNTFVSFQTEKKHMISMHSKFSFIAKCLFGVAYPQLRARKDWNLNCG